MHDEKQPHAKEEKKTVVYDCGDPILSVILPPFLQSHEFASHIPSAFSIIGRVTYRPPFFFVYNAIDNAVQSKQTPRVGNSKEKKNPELPKSPCVAWDLPGLRRLTWHSCGKRALLQCVVVFLGDGFLKVFCNTKGLLLSWVLPRKQKEETDTQNVKRQSAGPFLVLDLLLLLRLYCDALRLGVVVVMEWC